MVVYDAAWEPAISSAPKCLVIIQTFKIQLLCHIRIAGLEGRLGGAPSFISPYRRVKNVYSKAMGFSEMLGNISEDGRPANIMFSLVIIYVT
jgi:hypothetical protein